MLLQQGKFVFPGIQNESQNWIKRAFIIKYQLAERSLRYGLIKFIWY